MGESVSLENFKLPFVALFCFNCMEFKSPAMLKTGALVDDFFCFAAREYALGDHA